MFATLLSVLFVFFVSLNPAFADEPCPKGSKLATFTDFDDNKTEKCVKSREKALKVFAAQCPCGFKPEVIDDHKLGSRKFFAIECVEKPPTTVGTSAYVGIRAGGWGGYSRYRRPMLYRGGYGRMMSVSQSPPCPDDAVTVANRPPPNQLPLAVSARDMQQATGATPPAQQPSSYQRAVDQAKAYQPRNGRTTTAAIDRSMEDRAVTAETELARTEAALNAVGEEAERLLNQNQALMAEIERLKEEE